jgi:hypothetical protein
MVSHQQQPKEQYLASLICEVPLVGVGKTTKQKNKNGTKQNEGLAPFRPPRSPFTPCSGRLHCHCEYPHQGNECQVARSFFVVVGEGVRLHPTKKKLKKKVILNLFYSLFKFALRRRC